jgi:hypothetical protein
MKIWTKVGYFSKIAELFSNALTAQLAENRKSTIFISVLLVLVTNLLLYLHNILGWMDRTQFLREKSPAVAVHR